MCYVTEAWGRNKVEEPRKVVDHKACRTVEMSREVQTRECFRNGVE